MELAGSQRQRGRVRQWAGEQRCVPTNSTGEFAGEASSEQKIALAIDTRSVREGTHDIRARRLALLVRARDARALEAAVAVVLRGVSARVWWGTAGDVRGMEGLFEFMWSAAAAVQSGGVRTERGARVAGLAEDSGEM